VICFFCLVMLTLYFMGWFNDVGYEVTMGGGFMMGYDDWAWVWRSGL